MRRKTRTVKIGNLEIGSGHPIRIQSMAKADTRNVAAVTDEIEELRNAGCEIVRVAVKDLKAARAIRDIKRKIKIPLVADIHFNYKLALEAINEGADKIRINPGNIFEPAHIKRIIDGAKTARIPIRIGINSGSIPKGKNLVSFTRQYIKMFEEHGFRDIIISVKSSDVSETIEANKTLAEMCDYPFHLGVTAAGPLESSAVKSSIAISNLLLCGIGDTIRISLTGASIYEVKLAKDILSALKIRRLAPEIISCPTCGRCQVDLVKIVQDFKKKLYAIRYTLNAKCFPTIAIMGCEVNGPGEARSADIGVAFGKDACAIFKKGKIVKKIKAKNAVNELLNQL